MGELVEKSDKRGDGQVMQGGAEKMAGRGVGGKRKGAGWEGLASSHILVGGSAGCNRLQFRCTSVFLGPLPAASRS